MSIAYHYTPDSMWHYIRESGALLPYTPLVRVKHDINCSFPPWAYEQYLMAFLDHPEPWKGNKKFPDAWQRVMRHVWHDDIVLVRLMFGLVPEDEVYVMDWGHMEGLRGMGYNHGKWKRAKRQYLKSRIPLHDYKGGYELPELAIRNPILVDRITVAE